MNRSTFVRLSGHELKKGEGRRRSIIFYYTHRQSAQNIGKSANRAAQLALTRSAPGSDGLYNRGDRNIINIPRKKIDKD